MASFFEQTLSYSFQERARHRFRGAHPVRQPEPDGLQPALNELQVKLESRQKIYKLRETLQELGKVYGRIYIDTPPALNFFTRSALIGSSGCLIPFDCDSFSRQALYALLDNDAGNPGRPQPRPEGAGHCGQPVPARANLPQRMVAELIAEGLPVLKPYLPSSVKIRVNRTSSVCP